MNLHYIIKLVNMGLMIALGLITIRLLIRSLTYDRVRRSSPSKRAELLLKVFRDGAPYLTAVLNKGHYRVGRGPECELHLRGAGVPLKAGEIRFETEGYRFKPQIQGTVSWNDGPLADKTPVLKPNDEIRMYGYLLKVDERKA